MPAAASCQQMPDRRVERRDVLREILDLGVPVGDRGACFRELLLQSSILGSQIALCHYL